MEEYTLMPEEEHQDKIKISSNHTSFKKHILPYLWFGISIAIEATLLLVFPFSHEYMIYFMLPFVLVVIGYVIMTNLIFDLVDEVYDCGNYLMVINNGKKDKIYFKNISQLNALLTINPPRITLTLDRECKFGKEITFSPETQISLTMFSKNQILENLKDRVYKAHKELPKRTTSNT
jgi:hypothetical protein